MIAVAFDAVSTGTVVSSNTKTVSHTTSGTDRCLVVLVTTYVAGGTTVSSVTYNGTAMTNAGSQTSPSGNSRVTIFYLANPSSGAHDIVVTLAASADDLFVAGLSFTDVHQATPTGTFVSANGTSTTPSVVATSETGGMVVDGIMASSGSSAAVGAGQTSRYSLANAIEGYGSTEPGAASVTMSWTITSGNWAIAALPLKPVLARRQLTVLGAG